MLNINVKMNEEKKGIEIRFEAKPEKSILDLLKANGFRWSKPQKMWYAKQNESRIKLVNTLSSKEGVVVAPEIKQNNDEYDLWEMTRTEDIEHHYENERLHDTKEIAARIRTHLRQRFPMCKWSVRVDHWDYIACHLKSSPWAKDSDEVKAIAHYAYEYMESYNYDNSDLMTDYFDVNFYSNFEREIADYDYEQSKETVEHHEISENFQQKQREFKAAEEERELREAEEMRIRMEEERIKAQEYEKERQEKHDKIVDNVYTKDVDGYFILNLKQRSSKQDSVSGYLDEAKYEDEENHGWKRRDARVTRELHMNKETYDLLSHQLLDDYDFFKGMGGSATDDNRVNSMDDYERMTKEERETVEWYDDTCVAVFREGELMMVVDPEGFSYARYVLFPDDETVVKGEYKYEQVMSDKEREENKAKAEQLIKAIEIIISNMECEGSDLAEYKNKIKEWMRCNNFKLTKAIIREINDNELKESMYKLLVEVDSVQEQFMRAGFEENQPITIIKTSALGGLSVEHGKFKRYCNTSYAQYKDVVKLVYRPERKRKDYFTYLYNDMLIYNGYVDFPEDMFWITNDEGRCITRMSKYRAFDNRAYDDVLEYFDKQGIKPVVNTYKPEF